MDQVTWLATVKQHRAIAVIRAPSIATGLAMAQAVVAGGFRFIEVTWTSDCPAECLHQMRTALPSSCWVGAGTLLSKDALNDAIAAGAQFCFSPHTDQALIAIAQRQGIPVIPGALTPTEITLAWQSGASSVKVFPCQALGGPAYIRHLQGPLGHIPLIPTGGITVEEGHNFIDAGAIAVGIASSLFPKNLVLTEDWHAIEKRAYAFTQHLNSAISRI
ncbi:MAG: bifunctional 4-hydroxy-2-oxoglutarate aldolase/2-dehydro-3-deoxy-phosphogluconate aldolase [Cyanobacteria bacterium J06638_28]